MLSVARNTQRMEAPMKRAYFIGMDTHCQFCEIAAVNTRGDVVERDRCVTCIPALLEVIERVPRPRQLVIEEGPLAGWLWRHLHQAVDRMVVSEPRRNRLIALDGDKTTTWMRRSWPSCCVAVL